jgi:hypothetical protein
MVTFKLTQTVLIKHLDGVNDVPLKIDGSLKRETF